ncbi:unnamed protein product [Ectocarpus sp. CCAP 1310/34]|nr:unnamed protein product [Ectocarpus sp. CCAP 1310/34]
MMDRPPFFCTTRKSHEPANKQTHEPAAVMPRGAKVLQWLSNVCLSVFAP